MLLKDLKYIKFYLYLPIAWTIIYFIFRHSISSYIPYILFVSFTITLGALICCLGYLSLTINKDSFICFFGSINGACCIVTGLQSIILLTHILTSTNSLSIYLPPIQQIGVFFNYLFSSGICILISSIYCDSKKNKKLLFGGALSLIILITTLTTYFIIQHSSSCVLFSHPLILFFFAIVIILFDITVIYSLLVLKKKRFFTENAFSKDFLIIFISTSLFVIFSIFITPFSILSYYLGTLLYIVYLVVLFKMLIDVCVISSISDLMQKLLLHQENNQLLNKYVELISSANNNLKREYIQMDSVYKQMLDFYPDAFFIIYNHTITQANDFAAKLLQADSSQLLINKCFIDFITPEFLEAVIENISKLLSDELTSCSLEFDIITFQGQRIAVEGSFIKMVIENNINIIASIRDISDRKERLMLEHQIELEKLRLEFFSNISHELKTPVNIIYSATQLQNTLITQRDYHKLPLYNGMITQNCMRLLRLLNNLLDITKLDSNYFTFSPSHINIVSAIENTLESIAAYASRKKIHTLFDTTDEEIYCFLDIELLERILLNLLSNAIKYGIVDGDIFVYVTCDKKSAYIHIKDNGVGIPEDKFPYVFDRFMRIEAGLIRSAEGTGIGLSLVKSLVELQSGSVSFTSTLDVGTEFVILFDLSVPPGEVSESDYLHSIDTDKVDLEFSDVFIS